ncbi:hypothetical protein [Actinokineospora sp. NPDC004072]
MLYIVLVLVLAALGLLVAALTTASTLWAWLSIGISLAGAAILVVDWLGNRRRRAESADAAVARADPVVEAEPAEPSDDEPAEEPTDAADLLVVSELSAEVRVVDERPRYHLSRCTWLVGRPTLGLPVSEARQLGFTPCAVCSPDSVLAAQHRQTT